MEERWDAQKMLDLYVYDYMLRNNMHSTAHTFASEAGFVPQPVALNPLEGFLTEWWSLFWDVYCAQVEAARHVPEAPQGSLSKETRTDLTPRIAPTIANLAMPMHDFNQMPTPDALNMLQEASAMTTQMPQMTNYPAGYNMSSGKSMADVVSRAMNNEKERPRIPALGSSSNPHLSVNVAQLARLLPSSSNSSAPRPQISKKHQLDVTEADGYIYGTSSEGTSDEAKKPKTQPFNNARCSTSSSSRSSNSNPTR